MPSVFSPDLTAKSSLITVKNDEFHHLVHVFRAKINEKISIINGKGLLAHAEIREINKKNAEGNHQRHIHFIKKLLGALLQLKKQRGKQRIASTKHIKMGVAS